LEHPRTQETAGICPGKLFCEKSIRHERVVLTLLPECGQAAVAGDKGRFIAQGPELFPDGADQGVVIAAGQV
jgi:hypothetical protein